MRHYGYLDDIVTEKNKHSRNIQILEMMKEEDFNPWIDYHLASEYYREKKYNKAFHYLNQAIVKFLSQKQPPPPLLYKMKYEILVVLNSFDGAWPAIDRAIALYPDYVDLHFYKGLIFFGLGKYEEAIEVFQYCVILGENNLHHLTLKGAGSFQAWYYIGQCYEKLGQLENASFAFQACNRLSHNHVHAKEALEKLQNRSDD